MQRRLSSACLDISSDPIFDELRSTYERLWLQDCAPPEGELLTMIERDFGSLTALQEKFSAQTVAVQGSGWGWLGYNKATGKLAITTTANQVRVLSISSFSSLSFCSEHCVVFRRLKKNTLGMTFLTLTKNKTFLTYAQDPCVTTGLAPLLGVDVWEVSNS